jgi:hypothetical protein
MPIIPSDGPAGGEFRASSAFSAMGREVAPMVEGEFGGGRQPQVTRPVPIYAIDILSVLKPGAGTLQNARRTGWRYLIDQGRGLAVVDLPEDDNGEAEMLIGEDVGRSLARSGNLAEEIADSAIDYEARILDLNLIGDSVLWLRSHDDEAFDRFITLGLHPHEVSYHALLEKIKAAAAAKLTAMEGTKGEAGG